MREDAGESPAVFGALDSDDVLLVWDNGSATRINPLGSFIVGPVDSPALGSPLSPLPPDHPNYELEQAGGTETSGHFA